ncbi:MAG: hypothetical protein V3573_02390 [Desulfovibrionaceae bacterium]
MPRTLLSVCLLLAALLLSAGPTLAATLDQEDMDAIESVVNKAVAKRLAPVNRSLAMLEDKGLGPTEIAGGIGYIVGLGGLLAYAASKKKS